MEHNLGDLKNMADCIPVEMKKITDPDGTSRLGAVADLKEVLAIPDLKSRLMATEKRYQLLLENCRKISAEIKTKEGRSDASLRWQIGDFALNFLTSLQKTMGVCLVGHINALSRDLQISPRDLNYIVNFRRKYVNKEELDRRIDWSKYRELLEVSNPSLRKDLEEMIKKGRITTREKLRELKRSGSSFQEFKKKMVQKGR